MSELRHAEEQANLLTLSHPQRLDRYAQGRRLSSAGALSCRGAMSWGRPAYGQKSKSNPVRFAHSVSATAAGCTRRALRPWSASATPSSWPERWGGPVPLSLLAVSALLWLQLRSFIRRAGILIVSCPDLRVRRSSSCCASTRRQSPPAQERAVPAVGDRCRSGAHRSWNSGGRRAGALAAGHLELPAAGHRRGWRQERSEG